MNKNRLSVRSKPFQSVIVWTVVETILNSVFAVREKKSSVSSLSEMFVYVNVV